METADGDTDCKPLSRNSQNKRGVIGIVNPQKTSHCDPPDTAHGLCLA
eukprot:COSAG05_NODE_11143_length_528_cov_3.041958_1_plen_47_part_10